MTPVRATWLTGDVVIRLAAGRVSLKLGRRTVLACVVLVLAVPGLVLGALCVGTFAIAPADALDALLVSTSRHIRLLVVDWRLPRVAGALLAGAALGMAGALFQTLLRNPLGSPDVLGFDAGAFTGALLTILAGAAPFTVALAGFGGGLLAGFTVLLCAGRAHGVTSRIVVIGIAVGALFTAINDWIILTARLDTALAAASWRMGSLAGMEWAKLSQAGALLLFLMPLALGCARPLSALALGEERAASLGLEPDRARLAIAILGLALTATATFLAGPIGFVALIAPQLARLLAGGGGAPLLASALSGALFLLASDVTGRLLFAPRAIPAGAMTAAIGGVYFVALLRWRRASTEGCR